MNLSEKRKQKLGELVVRLGVKFNDLNLLNQALTHTSYANEAKDHSLHNERLEFLGDAVLELASSTYLFKTFTQMPEGEMTKARASVVCETSLAKLAMNLNVGQYLLLGKGERLTGGEHRPSILADAFEALIGAIYLDCGIEQARQFVLVQLKDDLLNIKDGNHIRDYKTLLQELIQAQADNKIRYEIISEAGPDHNKVFDVAVFINDKIFWQHNISA